MDSAASKERGRRSSRLGSGGSDAAREAVFDNLQRMPLVQLHAGGADDRAQGSRGASLLADHFAQVPLCYAQLEHGALRTRNGFNGYKIGLIDQSLGDLQHEFLHFSALL